MIKTGSVSESFGNAMKDAFESYEEGEYKSEYDHKGKKVKSIWVTPVDGAVLFEYEDGEECAFSLKTKERIQSF